MIAKAVAASAASSALEQHAAKDHARPADHERILLQRAVAGSQSHCNDHDGPGQGCEAVYDPGREQSERPGPPGDLHRSERERGNPGAEHDLPGDGQNRERHEQGDDDNAAEETGTTDGKAFQRHSHDEAEWYGHRRRNGGQCQRVRGERCKPAGFVRHRPCRGVSECGRDDARQRHHQRREHESK